jgi:DNA/RNA-binding domain of Phe-tRNA-synthetase-like protein
MYSIDDFELSVDDQLVEAGVAVGFLLLGGVKNQIRKKKGFESFRAALLRDLVENNTLADLAAHPYVRGYRQLHDRFGVADPSLVPSPESLYTLLFKHGDLRSINPIVDVYNYVALKHRLSCGAHDVDQLHGRIKLMQTTGSELFKPLGKSAERAVPTGEYAYVDGANRVICRLECKQADHSAVSHATTNVVIIVQGNASTPLPAIEDAMIEIKSLLQRCLGEPEVLRQDVLPVAETVRGTTTTSGAYA